MGHILKSGSRQLTQQLDVEELLLELSFLRRCTDGATAIEAGGVTVRSAVGAPGKLLRTPNAEASANNADTAIKRLNPTLKRGSPNFQKHFLNFEGWGRGMICHSVMRLLVATTKLGSACVIPAEVLVVMPVPLPL